MLSEFLDCFQSTASSTTHAIQHHIDTGSSRPISSPPHRTSAAENDLISDLVDDMLAQGIIRPSHSPWSSPVVLVRKKDGTPRFCVDYRKLNAATTRDVYPLPRIDDTLHSLGSSRVFSTLDLTASYWQVELDDESKPKSAFVCRRGLFEFVRMSFGLCNAPSTIQRLMDSVLAGLKWQICLVYLDDIIIFSHSFQQHLHDLRLVFSRLRQAHLSINLKKCHFASKEISYLGYRITSDGLKTDPAKIQAVSAFPRPTNPDTLRSFLGLAGYYRSFIRGFSTIASPLNALLHKDASWQWSSQHEQAFQALKTALVTTPVLCYPDFSQPFELHTDGACTAGIGVMLCQRDPSNNRVHAIAYASGSLSPAEKNYGVTELEALAVVWGMKKFAHYLTGMRFIVITDHQALQFLPRSADLRGRLARWALYLQQHDFQVVYRPGRANAGPDALSRFPLPDIASLSFSSSQSFIQSFLCGLSSSDLAAAQQQDSFCQSLLSLPLPQGFSLESGILFFGPRPVLPESLRQEVFKLLHGHPTSAHLGLSRTLQQFQRLYWFPDMRTYVAERICNCSIGTRTKLSRKSFGHTNLVRSDPPRQPFDTIAMDTFGPLPTSQSGNRYIVVTQCMFSRYVIITPVKVCNTDSVSNALIHIFSEHGFPRVMLSDNGSPYSASMLQVLCMKLGITQRYSPAYHPQ